MADPKAGPNRGGTAHPGVRRHIFLCSDQTKPKCCEKEAGIERGTI